MYDFPRSCQPVGVFHTSRWRQPLARRYLGWRLAETLLSRLAVSILRLWRHTETFHKPRSSVPRLFRFLPKSPMIFRPVKLQRQSGSIVDLSPCSKLILICVSEHHLKPILDDICLAVHDGIHVNQAPTLPTTLSAATIWQSPLSSARWPWPERRGCPRSAFA